jgi:hypothetical protein
MLEIYLGVNTSFLRSVKKVIDEQKWILVIQLRPWKSMQSWSEPSFFLMKRMGAP